MDAKVDGDAEGAVRMLQVDGGRPKGIGNAGEWEDEECRGRHHPHGVVVDNRALIRPSVLEIGSRFIHEAYFQ